LAGVDLADKEYPNGDSALLFATILPVQVPACGYSIACTFSEAFPDPPISVVSAGGINSFTVVTDSNLLIDVSTSTEVCTFDDSEYAGASDLSTNREQKITVLSSCGVNEITLNSEIGQFVYLMGVDTAPKSVNPDFSDS